MTRPSLAFVLVSLSCLACSSGDDAPDSGSGFTTVTAGTDPSSTSGSTTGSGSTTAAPTTGDDTTSTTTGDAPTTSTSTTDATTDASSTTGPICDPGQANCVCDGDVCVDGLVCEDGLCVPGVACDGDLGEPDDTEPDAQDLGEVTDDDDMTVMADGVLSGAADVDWYTYHGLDTFGHVGEPTIKVTSSATVRVCQFIECDEGGAVMTDITCPEGTQMALSGALRPGCCGGATFTISDYNCPGNTDNIQVYVRLDKPSQDECVEYGLVSHN